LAYIQHMQRNELNQRRLAVLPMTPGFAATGIFLFFGAAMASLAATTLLGRSTALDRSLVAQSDCVQVHLGGSTLSLGGAQSQEIAFPVVIVGVHLCCLFIH
jgi:hypothetical protein